MSSVTRRGFLGAGPIGIMGAAALASGGWIDEGVDGPTISDKFPTTADDRAREFVGACHFRIDRVREMLAEDGGLSKSSWDWGFGDWETAIGAASHTGQTEIIRILVEHGARPTLFTMATLDEIDAVRSVIENVPGAGALEGPHSISLYDHARAGKAERVLAYLDTKGGRPPNDFRVEKSFGETYFGAYAWGPGADERFDVSWFEKGSSISLKRPGHVARNLIPLGAHAFSPAGARHVRLLFEVAGDLATSLTVPRPEGDLLATRV